MLKSKPAGGGSAARAKVAMKSNKQLERQRSARRKQLHSSMQIGPKPTEASDFFMPHNKDLFNVPMDHVVSCKMPPYKAADLGKKELAKGTKHGISLGHYLAASHAPLLEQAEAQLPSLAGAASLRLDDLVREVRKLLAEVRRLGLGLKG